MKEGIHPKVQLCAVTCTCGNSFQILSDKEKNAVDLCSACHPFYTGQQKFVDSAGRVDRFAQRYSTMTKSLNDLANVKHDKRANEKLKFAFNPKEKKAPTLPPREGKDGAKAEGGAKDGAKAEKPAKA